MGALTLSIHSSPTSENSLKRKSNFGEYPFHALR
jgi:hypothetical protein